MNREKKVNQEAVGVLLIVLSALFASIYQPYSKILTGSSFSIYLFGAFAFSGSTIFCLIYFLIELFNNRNNKEKLNLLSSFKDYLFAILSGLFSVGANIFLLTAMNYSKSASEVSLFTNFEVIVTITLARIIFKEKVKYYTWIASPFIVIGAIMLSLDFSTGEGISFSLGSLYAIGACFCWALENNFSKLVSNKNAAQVTCLKHCIGTVVDFILVFIMAYISKESIVVSDFNYPLMAFGIGAFSLGLTFILYVNAQRRIGTSRSSALYSLSPFLGSLLYLLIMKEKPEWNFYLGAGLIFTGQLIIMVFTLINSNNNINNYKKNLTNKIKI